MKNYIVLAIVCLGTLISAYIGSCVNIALPNIMAALNFNMDSIVWVSLGYLLPYGSLLPLTGKMGDKYGAKKVYVIGLILFTVASFLCGTSTNSTLMIGYRILQGVGGSMLLPNAMSIVAGIFTGPARASALGIWSAMAAAGAALGPTVGGYLIDIFNWRAIFFSVMPLCLLGIVLAVLLIPKSAVHSEIRIDFFGGILLIVSISALLIALNQGEKEGWLRSYYIASLLYIAAAAFVMFILAELHTPTPIVDLSLFKNLNFVIANVLSGVTFFTLYGAMFLLPFFMKSILNFSSIQAGVMMLAQTVTMVIFAPLGGRLSARIGVRFPALFGMTLAAYAFYLLKDINSSFGTYDFCVPLAIYGIGLGFTMSPLTSCAIAALPHDKIGVGSGIFNFSKMISGGVGVVMAQFILTQREVVHGAVLKSYLNSGSPPEAVFQIVATLHNQHIFGSSSFVAAVGAQLWTTASALSPSTAAGFLQVLGSMVSKQASIYSFQDTYFILMLLCSSGVFLALFIRNHETSHYKEKRIKPISKKAAQ